MIEGREKGGPDSLRRERTGHSPPFGVGRGEV